MENVFYFTPLHHKIIIFDDVTWLAIIIIVLISFYIITKFNARPRN